MRIAMLVSNPPRRGTFWRAYYFGRELARRGHRVALIHTAETSRLRFQVQYEEQGRLALIEAPDMLPGGLRAGWDVWASLARALWLGGLRFDLLHAFESRPAVIIPALATRLRNRVPLVLDWCDWFGRGGSVEERPNPLQRELLRPLETFFEERFRRYADATTVINQVLGRKAEGLGVNPATITLLRNGCDVSDWPNESRAEARSALGLPADEPLIGYVGVIFARDARLMARAFDRLRERIPNARLLVAGYCNIAIEDLVRERAAVLRTGPLDTPTLRRYLRACDIAWAPLSDSGANRGRWPLKLSTYMEAGLPFITTAVGDLAAFLRHYPVGIAAAPESSAVAALTADLLNNPARAEAMGATGHQLAAGELSWARLTDTLETLYRRLMV